MGGKKRKQKKASKKRARSTAQTATAAKVEVASTTASAPVSTTRPVAPEVRIDPEEVVAAIVEQVVPPLFEESAASEVQRAAAVHAGDTAGAISSQGAGGGGESESAGESGGERESGGESVSGGESESLSGSESEGDQESESEREPPTIRMSEPPVSEPPGAIDQSDHRAYPRVALAIAIDLESDSHFFSGLSGDVSEGGVFVQTYRDLPVGAEVDLEFDLPSGHVATHGTVRWHRQNSDSAPPGVGIAFESLEDEERSKIHEFCAARAPLYYDVEHA